METFIIGSSGLIGSAIREQLAGSMPFPIKLPWENLDECTSLIKSWNVLNPETGIVWAAGNSGVSTTKEMLDSEMRLFQAFLSALKTNRSHIRHVLLVSSAGGVFGEAPDEIITESTVPNPISEYGRMKLHQENELRKLATQCGFRALIARVSNAYGPAQDLNKKQGLISQLVKASLEDKPITIYVPMDTKRDYIYTSDVGMKLSRFVLESNSEGANVTTKIIASGVSNSITQIVNEIYSLTGIKTQIELASQTETSLQPRSLAFKSEVLPSIDDVKCVSMAEGINMVIANQRTLR